MSDEQLSMFPGDTPAAGETAKSTSFSLSRTVAGNAQKVFDQWLIPVFIGEWLLGKHAGDDEVLELTNTVRRGGEFNYQARRAGKMITYQGVYQELRIPVRLGFNWQVSTDRGKESQVNVEFEEQGEKTRVKLKVKLPSELATRKDSLKDQWAARLDALAARFRPS